MERLPGFFVYNSNDLNDYSYSYKRSHEHICLYVWLSLDKEMLPTSYVALFLVVHVIHNEAAGFNSFYAIKTNEYPKSSCHKISDIKSKSRCLNACERRMDMIVMISHDDSTNTCMCCNNITGKYIAGQNWKSYAPRSCKYFYNYTEHCISK